MWGELKWTSLCLSFSHSGTTATLPYSPLPFFPPYEEELCKEMLGLKVETALIELLAREGEDEAVLQMALKALNTLLCSGWCFLDNSLPQSLSSLFTMTPIPCPYIYTTHFNISPPTLSHHHYLIPHSIHLHAHCTSTPKHIPKLTFAHMHTPPHFRTHPHPSPHSHPHTHTHFIATPMHPYPISHPYSTEAVSLDGLVTSPLPKVLSTLLHQLVDQDFDLFDGIHQVLDTLVENGECLLVGNQGVRSFYCMPFCRELAGGYSGLPHSRAAACHGEPGTAEKGIGYHCAVAKEW